VDSDFLPLRVNGSRYEHDPFWVCFHSRPFKLKLLLEV